MKDAGGFGSPADPDCLEPVERFAAEAPARHFAGSTAQVAFNNPAFGSAFKADGKFGIVPKIEVGQNLRPYRQAFVVVKVDGRCLAAVVVPDVPSFGVHVPMFGNAALQANPWTHLSTRCLVHVDGWNEPEVVVHERKLHAQRQAAADPNVVDIG